MPGVGCCLCPSSFQEGLPRPLWSLAHPFSELLCHWREVRGRYECLYKGRGLCVFGSRAPPAPRVGDGGLAPEPWQSRGGAVCRMASAKAGRRKAAQTKGRILFSEGGREAAVSPGLLGPGPRRRGMRLKACSHAGQRVESGLFGFDFERPF